jgi:hypothetical protein
MNIGYMSNFLLRSSEFRISCVIRRVINSLKSDVKSKTGYEIRKHTVGRLRPVAKGMRSNDSVVHPALLK